jgi:hypothetical protein
MYKININKIERLFQQTRAYLSTQNNHSQHRLSLSLSLSLALALQSSLTNPQRKKKPIHSLIS